MEIEKQDWEIHKRKSRVDYLPPIFRIKNKENSFQVAKVARHNPDAEAIARLISAAPELLAAAEWAYERLICLYGDEGELSSDLEDAIEKATGIRPSVDDFDDYTGF